MKRLSLILIIMGSVFPTLFSQEYGVVWARYADREQMDTLNGRERMKWVRHYWETDSTSVNIIVKNMNNYDAIVEKLALLPFASQTKIPLRLLLEISQISKMKLL